MSEISLAENYPEHIISSDNQNNLFSFGLQIVFVILVVLGIADSSLFYSDPNNNFRNSLSYGQEIRNAGKFNILSSDDISKGIKDTVYTKKDCWLELRIDQQMLYQHWRDGRTEKYPVSSGNNKGGDPEALESRPGLFAIFHKEEHHQSSQFESANMYHFMPFNQGIGFHSIDGTGYYVHLGVRPSSHGCIRMKHEDAKKLYGDCELGTLVIASKGYSARTIAFADKDFQNEKDYSKDEFKFMLANNLYNIMSGKYYTEEREKFVVDPKVIPVSGVYTSYDIHAPERQTIPRNFITYTEVRDKTRERHPAEVLQQDESEEFIKLVSIDPQTGMNTADQKKIVGSTADLIKQYFNNPIGVMPYFGPKR